MSPITATALRRAAIAGGALGATLVGHVLTLDGWRVLPDRPGALAGHRRRRDPHRRPPPRGPSPSRAWRPAKVLVILVAAQAGLPRLPRQRPVGPRTGDERATITRRSSASAPLIVHLAIALVLWGALCFGQRLLVRAVAVARALLGPERPGAPGADVRRRSSGTSRGGPRRRRHRRANLSRSARPRRPSGRRRAHARRFGRGLRLLARSSLVGVVGLHPRPSRGPRAPSCRPRDRGRADAPGDPRPPDPTRVGDQETLQMKRSGRFSALAISALAAAGVALGATGDRGPGATRATRTPSRSSSASPRSPAPRRSRARHRSPGSAPGATTAQLQDLRFYISNVRLVRAERDVRPAHPYRQQELQPHAGRQPHDAHRPRERQGLLHRGRQGRQRRDHGHRARGRLRRRQDVPGRPLRPQPHRHHDRPGAPRPDGHGLVVAVRPQVREDRGRGPRRPGGRRDDDGESAARERLGLQRVLRPSRQHRLHRQPGDGRDGRLHQVEPGVDPAGEVQPGHPEDRGRPAGAPRRQRHHHQQGRRAGVHVGGHRPGVRRGVQRAADRLEGRRQRQRATRSTAAWTRPCSGRSRGEPAAAPSSVMGGGAAASRGTWLPRGAALIGLARRRYALVHSGAGAPAAAQREAPAGRRLDLEAAGRLSHPAGAGEQPDDEGEGRSRALPLLRHAAVGQRHAVVRQLPPAGQGLHRRPRRSRSAPPASCTRAAPSRWPTSSTTPPSPGPTRPW